MGVVSTLLRSTLLMRLLADGLLEIDWACSRYSMSYPNILNNDPRLGDPKRREFEFRSCSGAVTREVIDNQVSELASDQQVILLSTGPYRSPQILPRPKHSHQFFLGGNDVQLVNILNQCIFQWASLQKSQGVVSKIAALADQEPFSKLDLDIGAITRTCVEQLDHTQQLIDGDQLTQHP